VERPLDALPPLERFLDERLLDERLLDELPLRLVALPDGRDLLELVLRDRVDRDAAPWAIDTPLSSTYLYFPTTPHLRRYSELARSGTHHPDA
jgi:hypothetical protein